MVQIFKDTYEDLTPAALEQLIDDLAAGRKVRVGPQIDRHHAAPEGGPTTLIEPGFYAGTRSFTRVEPPPPPAADAPAPAAAVASACCAGTGREACRSQARRGTTRRPPWRSTAEPVKLAETPPAPRKPAKAEDDGKPELLKKPKGGKGDDLKLIWGVGPKLEKMLNGMGVWHFDQIAAWTAKELAWVDANAGRLQGPRQARRLGRAMQEAGDGLASRQRCRRKAEEEVRLGDAR